MRLTKPVRERLLLQNEGFTTRSSFGSRNSECERIYTITGGRLRIREMGKTSWADSRYDNEWGADDEETHRFLYNNLGLLSAEGLE